MKPGLYCFALIFCNRMATQENIPVTAPHCSFTVVASAVAFHNRPCAFEYFGSGDRELFVLAIREHSEFIPAEMRFGFRSPSLALFVVLPHPTVTAKLNSDLTSGQPARVQDRTVASQFQRNVFANTLKDLKAQ